MSINDGVDTTTPGGRFSFHIFAAVAELEREILRERVVAGMDAARRRGANIGRPRVRVDVAKAIAQRAAGKSYREIANAFGCGVGTVHRAIKQARNSVPEGGPESALQVNGISPSEAA